MATTYPQQLADKNAEPLAQAVKQDEWIAMVESLLTQVESWAHERQWPTERRMEELNEGNGPYQVPVLTVTTPAGQVALEPIARLVIGAEGRIDFYDMATMARVKLLLKDGTRWIIRTDSGINWPNPWGQETFYQLTDALQHTE